LAGFYETGAIQSRIVLWTENPVEVRLKL